MWERLQESNPKPGCMAPGHLTDGPGHVSEGDLSQRLCRKEHLSGPSRAVPVGGLAARPPAQDTRARSRESVPAHVLAQETDLTHVDNGLKVTR